MPDTEHLHADQAIDLTNCDREPIHILGQVQGFGCLVAISADWMITHASENCADHLGQGPDALIGTMISDILSADAVHHLRSKMQMLDYQNGVARIFAYPLFKDDRLFDISIHTSGRHVVLEFEPREGATPPDQRGVVQALIARVQRQDTLDRMSAEASRGLKILSGFDRVMVYRFEEDDSGTVISEAVEPDMETFMGLRFPASDIPKQARDLYLRSPLRIIADVDAPTHAIQPPVDPNGEPLDLSLAVTRAVSPIHLEYLRNMGVAASMSVSILRKGKLWGLFACHHREPHFIDYEKRSAIELFAQLFNYELAQIEMHAELAELDRARTMHDRLMTRLSNGQSIVDTFDTFVDEIRDVIPFDGAAIYSDGMFRVQGAAPTEEEFIGLARFLNTTPPGQIYATDALASRYPAAEGFADRAVGLLALPISRTPRDYLVLFRREIARSVSWAGNPEKPVEVGPNGIRLTPRKSFEAWQQVVRGQSAAWKSAERRAADALRVTLLEVVLKLADESNAARKRAQDQQELLIAELNHRVRNILNLIRGLVSQGRDGAQTVDDYRSVLDDRIHSLARAHDQLTQTEWNWVSLRSLISTEIKAFMSGKSARVHLSGDDIDLSPTAFTTLALVIHELVTNSAKYGSLTDMSGSVDITVGLQQDGTATLAWREKNGPAVQAPTRKGFGTTIIERSIPFELKGMAEVRFRMTGFEADFVLPAKHVRRAVVQPDGDESQSAAAPTTAGIKGDALVLEDNMIIALDAVDMLTELGASNVRTASRVSDALRILKEARVTVALVDVNLGDELSFPAVDHCVATGVPVVLATGYGADPDLTAKYPKVPIMRKPYTSEQLSAAVAKAIQGTGD